MANNENLIPIPGRLHSVATEGHVAGANEIYDDTLQKNQATINSELIAAVGTGGSVDSRIAAAINALDATKSQTAGADGLALSIVEENGKITSISGSIAANTYDANGAAAAAKSEVLGSGVGTDYNTLKKIEDKLSPIETAVGTGGSIDQRIEDATEDCAYLGEDDGSEVIADFDPQTDTVWKKAQTLSNAEKSQVKTNLGLPQEIYSKTEVNELVSTPHQNYVTVATYSELPASGSTDTIYRVSNYDGTQVAAGVYSEYAWNGSDYVFLAAKSSVDEVFDISEYHAGAKYADLAAALDSNNGGGVPQSLQKGGMSVKFVSNSDNKYMQYRLMKNTWSTTASDWQGVDDEPIVGSDNLVKSGGVDKIITKELGNHTLDLTTITNNPILFDDNGTWRINQSSYQGRYFHCVAGCKYIIIPPTNKTCLVSFLKSLNTTAPDYAENTTRIGKRGELEIIAPQDAIYIWVATKYADEDITPSIKIDGEGFTRITNAETNIRDINLFYGLFDGLSIFTGWLDGSSPSIVEYNQYTKFVVIPSKGRKKIHIIKDSGSALMFFAKNYITTTGTLELATGETGRRSVIGDAEISLPEDIGYIYLQISDYNNNNIKPKYLSIDGIKIIDVSRKDDLSVIDDAIIIGSENPVKNNAIYESIAKDIGFSVDLSTITNNPKLYDDWGTWLVNSPSYTGIYFPVIHSCKYRLTPPVGKSSVYSFVKSVEGTSVDYATGSSRKTFSQEVIVSVPEDANYLWVMTSNNWESRRPQVKIIGEGMSSIKDLSDDFSHANSVLFGNNEFSTFTGWFDGSQPKIVSYNNATFRVFPIKNRKKVHLLCGRTALVFFAKNYLSGVGSLQLATGETGRRAINSNSDTFINIPTDAAYFYVQALDYEGNDRTPYYISVDGVALISSEYTDGITNDAISYEEKNKLASALQSPVAQSEQANIFTFIHTSDTHIKPYNSKCFENIISLLGEDYINALIHTGDIVWDNFPYNNDDSAKGLQIFSELIQNTQKDVIITVGNHDVGGSYKDVNTSGTDEQVYTNFYAPLMKNNFVAPENKPYFYVDYAQGIRFISLYQYNTDFALDPSDNTKLKDVRGLVAWRQEEITWLCNTLNSTPEGYAVFILTHQPEAFGPKIDSWQSRKIANSNVSETPPILVNIVNAFINRTTINATYEQTVGVSGTITVEYDFSNSVGLFAAFLNGHMHDDFVGKLSYFDLNQLNKNCDNIGYQSGSSIGHVYHTYNENTINVVSVNTSTKTITVFRIGAKYSADGDYRDVKILSY